MTVHSETVPGARYWSMVIRRGYALRIVDPTGRANAATLAFNPHNLAERYDMADTLKAQHTAYLTAGCVCYSDMGRVLCSITADSCGWHDALCGFSDAQSIATRYGNTRFQDQRNERYGNGRDAMLNELGKYGLGARDLVAGINFFSKVTPDDTGKLHWQRGHCTAGDFVELRFEMDTLALFHAGPHPLDAGERFLPKSVLLTAWYSGPAPAVDACRDRCAENQRGFRNTEMMYLA